MANPRWTRARSASSKQAYFIAEPLKPVDQWQYCRRIAKERLSSEAQLKLEWIIFYHTIGRRHATLTAKHFGIARKTLHKWLKRFDESHLERLEERNRVPAHVRQWGVTKAEEQAILALRKAYMGFGEKKLCTLYRKRYGCSVSRWKIGRVIKKYRLYPDRKALEHFRRRRIAREARIRIHHFKREGTMQNQFGLIHIDTIVLYWFGSPRYIFTAIEEQTRLAYARVYTTNSSLSAKDFLHRLFYLFDSHIRVIHTDNGSEFQGAFERTCKELGIAHIYSRPYTPKDNAKLERFNYTIQKNWLAFSEEGLDNVLAANRELTQWLELYNSVRPHESLGGKTPLEFAQEQFFSLLPMWSGQTSA